MNNSVQGSKKDFRTANPPGYRYGYQVTPAEELSIDLAGIMEKVAV